jgi:hypothetical protein
MFQSFGHYVTIKHWNDLWIIYGCASYLTEMYSKHQFGTNQHRYRLAQDFDYITNKDFRSALRHDRYLHPSELVSNPVFVQKCCAVFYMLERRLGPDSFRKVIFFLENFIHFFY